MLTLSDRARITRQMNTRTKRVFQTIAMLGVFAVAASAQDPRDTRTQGAERGREEFRTLLRDFPPAVRQVIAEDPALLANQEYLAPYPALAGYLKQHPEVARNPGYYVGEPDRGFERPDSRHMVLSALGAFIGFGMAIGLATWLIRTILNYRRWNRLTKIQTEVHTKLLDRFTANEEVLAYMQSPAGAKFLESTPIAVDGAQTVSAPLGRILLSVQAGFVLLAGGGGCLALAPRISPDVAEAIYAVGVLAIAVGAGFLISAAASFFISRRLGLIQTPEKQA